MRCEMWDVRCEMWDVRYEMWDVRCEIWDMYSLEKVGYELVHAKMYHCSKDGLAEKI